MSLHKHQSLLQLFNIGLSCPLVDIVVPLYSYFLLEIGIPMEDLGRLVLGNVDFKELFQFVAQFSGPLLGAVLAEGWMLQGILHIGESIELEELRCARQILPSRVKILLEVVQLSFQIFVLLDVGTASHKGRENGEVDLQIKLQLLADEILLSKHDGYLSVPQCEELISVTLVEGLPHQLNGLFSITDESLLDVGISYLVHLILQNICSLGVSIFVEIFKNGDIDVSLGCSEVVQVQS